MNRDRAALGWAAIFVVVLGYDGWALVTGRTTLSAWFWRIKTQRWFRWVIPACWVSLSWHLLFGDRKFLVGRPAVIYRRVHPLYVARDHLIVIASRRDIQKSEALQALFDLN